MRLAVARHGPGWTDDPWLPRPVGPTNRWDGRSLRSDTRLQRLRLLQSESPNQRRALSTAGRWRAPLWQWRHEVPRYRRLSG
jgi:hypothetical protein